MPTLSSHLRNPFTFIHLALAVTLLAPAYLSGQSGEAASDVTITTVSSDTAQPTLKPSLKKGINLAGDFEVDPRGDWGTPIEGFFFDRVAAAGFDHVRVPIRWSAYTGKAPEFTIDNRFFKEVDWLLEQAHRSGLSIIINTHHFEELDAAPQQNRAQLIAIWRQVAERYATQPATVVFELNNEPSGSFNTQATVWNSILADTLALIRQSNPKRLVIVGPVGYNHPARLADLELPADNNLMATIHVYDPITFTLQAAPWMQPPPAIGTLWSPHTYTLDNRWTSTSWDSTLMPGKQGIRVEFHRQYAAFSATRNGFSSDEEASGYHYLKVDANQHFDALVLCNVADSNTPVAFDTAVTGQNGLTQMQADVSACGAIQSIAIQLASRTLAAPVISAIDLCRHSSTEPPDCDPLLVTGARAHQRLMKYSANWAQSNGVPLYLGEFGVFDAPYNGLDQASKLAWIYSMRTAAEANNINWAFFEFSGEFGAYNHAQSAWRAPVLKALFD